MISCLLCFNKQNAVTLMHIYVQCVKAGNLESKKEQVSGMKIGINLKMLVCSLGLGLLTRANLLHLMFSDFLSPFVLSVPHICF